MLDKEQLRFQETVSIERFQLLKHSSFQDFEADVTRISFLLSVHDKLAILQKTVNQAWGFLRAKI